MGGIFRGEGKVAVGPTPRSLECPWGPLHLCSELSKRTVLFFPSNLAFHDLRDHGGGQGPSEGKLGALKTVMGAQQTCCCCLYPDFSPVPRGRSSTQGHLCTVASQGHDHNAAFELVVDIFTCSYNP